jgi:peptidoglycan/xylan/chitin deacetylase (PgdA/CDA1 family)
MFVLNFHLIGRPRRDLAPGEAEVALDPAQFAEILHAIAGRNDVRVTFDDGNASDVSQALPELEQRGLKAQFFVCPGRFGSSEFVDEHDVRELCQTGMSVGSHGMDHVRWRKLDRSALAREIGQAKQALEEALQAPVVAAACPFGAYDRRTLRALGAAGFSRVYTSDGGRTTLHDWLVPRNTVRRRDSAESIERMLDRSATHTPVVEMAKRWVKRRR